MCSVCRGYIPWKIKVFRGLRGDATAVARFRKTYEMRFLEGFGLRQRRNKHLTFIGQFARLLADPVQLPQEGTHIKSGKEKKGG